MATLTLTHKTDAASGKTRLREWLGGNWAVLFSHPEDFAPHPTTPEGFITLLADDFAACGVKPISLGDDSTAVSWLDFAGADTTNIVLDTEPESGQVVDLAERRLALQLERTLALKLQRVAARFVIVLDEKARCRTTITYDARHTGRHRTVEDILRVVEILRHRVPAVPQKRLERAAAG